MQYLGGKTRIAKDIATIVNKERGNRLFWDPFCGGLSMSLALGGLGLISDAQPALIALYAAVASGWLPPENLSEKEYADARKLPDANPLKAFAGFGCSFGGKWFGGYARNASGENYARNAARSLMRAAPHLAQCRVACIDFLSQEPQPLPVVLYLDPPYAGTTPYSGCPAFDSSVFWSRVAQWEYLGVPCFISEYSCPLPHKLLWEKPHTLKVAGGGQVGARTEKLFRVIL